MPQRDTEFIKLMKAAPYLTVEYFLANTKNKMALVSFIGEFILNSYCVKQPTLCPSDGKERRSLSADLIAFSIS
jgi:hypothetical protein